MAKLAEAGWLLRESSWYLAPMVYGLLEVGVSLAEARGTGCANQICLVLED